MKFKTWKRKINFINVVHAGISANDPGQQILLSSRIWYLLVAFFFCLWIGSAQAQNIKMGASVAGIISGNGFGPSLSPQVMFATERHSLSAGINIQSRHSNFTGFRGRYEFIINPTDAQELFLFYDLASHTNAYLSKYVAAQESIINPEFEKYFYNVKVKTIEHHFGFGMNLFVADGLKVFGAIGAGYYFNRKCYDQCLFQYREENNFSLLIMAGLKLNIKRIR